MKAKYWLFTLVACFGSVAFSLAQGESEKPKAEIAIAPKLEGSWRPLEKMEVAEGVVPEMAFFADGRFRLVSQTGEQMHGKFTVTEKDGAKILTLNYAEVEKPIVFKIVKLDDKNLDIQKEGKKKVTQHERIEQKAVKNPLVPE
jgi:hypothetical protein